MTIDEIKELIRVVHDTGIAELEVQRGENRVRIRRTTAAANQEIVLPAALPLSVGVPAAPAIAASAAPPTQENAAAIVPGKTSETQEDNHTLVKSPIVGTYYDSPSPGDPPFVKVGDRVEPRQVLCIIESMKLMNEIEAEVAGIIAAKLVENGRPVEYGETLFHIRPL